MPPRREPPRQRNNDRTTNNDNIDGNPVQQLVTLLTGALQNQPQNHGTTFQDFKAVGPPEFRGSMNPVEAQT